MREEDDAVDDGWPDGHDLDDEDGRLEEAPRLGPCCACGKEGPDVRSIVMLDKKSPLPGRGWGCACCGLPSDGASYVLCDSCFEEKREPLFACRGYPGEDGRVPIGELAGTHTHDEEAHALAEAAQEWPDQGAEDEPWCEPGGEGDREPQWPADYFRCHRCGMMAEGPALMLWPEDESFLWELCNDCFGRLTGHRITYPPYQRKRDDPAYTS